MRKFIRNLLCSLGFHDWHEYNMPTGYYRCCNNCVKTEKSIIVPGMVFWSDVNGNERR
jgi:hypothetical protein